MAAADEAAMQDCGAACARLLAGRPAFIALRGDLGAGKTTWVRGFLRAQGHAGAVRSPTFTLVEPYRTAAGAVNHFDLYRVEDPYELELIGIRDYFDDGSTCLVEWPERGAGMLPGSDLTITITLAAGGRDIDLRAGSALGREILAGLAPAP